jgi:hypothetical protein
MCWQQMMTVYDTSNKVAEIRVSKLKLAVYGTPFAVVTILLCVFSKANRIQCMMRVTVNAIKKHA